MSGRHHQNLVDHAVYRRSGAEHSDAVAGRDEHARRDEPCSTAVRSIVGGGDEQIANLSKRRDFCVRYLLAVRSISCEFKTQSTFRQRAKLVSGWFLAERPQANVTRSAFWQTDRKSTRL